jgi:DNA polymerase III delta prime subunit
MFRDVSQPVWSERYRPRTINELILPFNIKKIFTQYRDAGIIDSDLLLAGAPGSGKTSVIKALLAELGNEYIFVNASLKGNIDTLRNEIQQFASTMSFDGKRKYVVLDEADKITQAAQGALRAFIEEFTKTTGFIYTCNNKNGINEAIRSRTSIIDFTISTEEQSILAKSWFKRVIEILELENVPYDKATVRDLIWKNFPDYRHTLNQLQKASKTGSIDENAFFDSSEKDFEELIGYMKSRNFDKAREWLKQHPDMQATDLFRRFYDQAYDHLEPATIPLLILNIAKYQYQHAFVADQEVNCLAFIVETMADCTFKG